MMNLRTLALKVTKLINNVITSYKQVQDTVMIIISVDTLQVSSERQLQKMRSTVMYLMIPLKSYKKCYLKVRSLSDQANLF